MRGAKDEDEAETKTGFNHENHEKHEQGWCAKR